MTAGINVFICGITAALVLDCYANVVNPDAVRADCDYITAYIDNPRPLTSENYPDGYNSYTNECWIVQAFHTLDYVNITIDDIDIESSPNCTKDQILIRDGTVFESALLFSHCGTLDHSVNIQSSGGYLLIVFVSDGQVQSGRGFQVTYQSHDSGIERHSGSMTRNVILAILCAFALFSIIMGFIMMCIEKRTEKQKEDDEKDQKS